MSAWWAEWDDDAEEDGPEPRPRVTPLARALALAFLTTDGSRRAMLDVAVAVSGVPRERWGALVGWVRRAFHPVTRASLDELTWTIAASRAFTPERHVVPRRWPLPPSEMLAPRWDVPRIDTTGDLARWLAVEITEIDWLADRRAMLARAPAGPLHHYVCTRIAKPSGGVRVLEAPKARLAAIQRRVLHEILDRVPPHDAAHGFRKKRSVATFVAPHVGRALVLRVDLEDFFASVTRGRVIGIFRSAGYTEEVARTLAALCTTRTPSYALRGLPWEQRARLRVPHLPQGAPSSPALASLAAFRLDARIDGLARALGARFTRYADDLALSFGRAPRPAAVDRLVARLAEIAREEGFALATHKTRVMRRGARQALAGVVVNERAGAPREEYERLRAILHRAGRDGASGLDRAHLEGRIAWIGGWSEARRAKLRALFERIVW